MHRDDPLAGTAAAAARGDEHAFAALVRATQADVWRFLAALSDPDSADDLTQETYLRVFSALPRFRGEASVRTWLLAIARRVAVDHLRRRGRSVPSAGQPRPDDWVSPDQTGHVDVADLVAGLPADRKTAFVLTQLLGLSYDEAARVCEVPIGTIRSRVARARAEMVAALAPAQVQTRAR